MVAEDDDYWDEDDDIGEYDEKPSSAVSNKPKPTPPRHTTPLYPNAPVSAATAMASISVVRHTTVSAKKKGSGWDDVDIGELTIQQMDERIELEKKQQEAQQLAVQRARQWNNVSHQDAVNAQYQAQLQRQQQQQRQQQPQTQRASPFSARGRTSFGRGGPRAGVPIVPSVNVRLAGSTAGLGLSGDYAGGRRIDAADRGSGGVSLGKKRKAGEMMVSRTYRTVETAACSADDARKLPSHLFRSLSLCWTVHSRAASQPVWIVHSSQSHSNAINSNRLLHATARRDSLTRLCCVVLFVLLLVVYIAGWLVPQHTDCEACSQ